MNNTEPHIVVEDLTMAYGDFVVQSDLTFTINRSDIFIIMGGSGCGKSTLLKHLIGLQKPAKGKVFLSGESLWDAEPQERERMMRQFGVLYQKGALWSSMTLSENIALPLGEYTDLSPTEIKEIASLKLALVGLTGFEDYWFTSPLGLLPMHLSLHSEVATLPVSFADKGVKDCFFKINYWGMAKKTVEKVGVLVDFGFANREAVAVKGQPIVPRDLLITMMGDYVPPITDFLAPPKTKPPDWAKEIVTEVRGTKDGKEMTYRLGTLTCKGALPTGVVPARGAIWLAQGKVAPGVHPPELAIDPVPFFHDLENRDIYVQVTVTELV